MTKTTAERIARSCDKAGLDAHVREYSGRFMFGEKTWAVVVSATTVEVLTAVLNHSGPESPFDGVAPLRQDEFGLGIVLY